MKSRLSNSIYAFVSMQSEFFCQKRPVGLVVADFKNTSVITEKVINKYSYIYFLITLSNVSLIVCVIYNLFTRTVRNLTQICYSPCLYLPSIKLWVMNNVKDILMIQCIVALVIYTIYFILHLNDFLSGYEEIKNFGRYMEDPKCEE